MIRTRELCCCGCIAILLRQLFECLQQKDCITKIVQLSNLMCATSSQLRNDYGRHFVATLGNMIGVIRFLKQCKKLCKNYAVDFSAGKVGGIIRR